MRTNPSFFCWLIVTATLGCQPSSVDDAPASPETIDAGSLLQHIRTLASDEFEGRLPGTAGGEKTVAYLTEQFRAFGLEPGNPDGSYRQSVPLVGITQRDPSPMTVRLGEETLTLQPEVDVAASTRRVVSRVSSEAEMVFVGYGVVAPEYEWDDFEGIDVGGKLLLALVNDPPSSEGEEIFGGEAMTYYGRWPYKFEIGEEKGAAGVLVIHETGPAGYPWNVISGVKTEKFDLASDHDGDERLKVEGWIHVNAVREILKIAGHDFDSLKEAAAKRDFEPVPLGATAEIEIQNTTRRIDSSNVIAKLEGAEAPDELVLYVAHWDHMGQDPSLDGDTIFNGAKDNASGTAGLLEIAEAFSRLEERPSRTVAFLAVTAEEQGLLGSRYYAENPLYPPEKTAAVINMDGLNLLGPTRDITVVGMGQSSLDELAGRIAAEQGRVLRPDPEPEKGFYYRSDHFEFAKIGIPAFYADAGIQFINRPENWGIEMRETYTREHYHKPSDEVKDYWDLAGAVEDLELFYRMGVELATSSVWPEWSEKSEFRARRLEQRKVVEKETN